MTNPFGETSGEYNPFASTNVDSFDATHTNEVEQASPIANDNTQNIGQTNTTSYDYEAQTTSTQTGKAELKDPVTGLRITLKDIEERERVLNERENRISNREREVADAKANGTVDQLNKHPRNFPPFFKWYKYYPEEDLPEDSLKLMNYIKWVHYAVIIALLINVIGCIASLAHGASSAVNSPGANILFGIIYFIVISYLSLDLCFMVLYNALMNSKALKFIGFLITYGILFIVIAYIAIGINNYGSVGWITAINVIGNNAGIGAFYFIFSILITLVAVALGWTWYMAYKYFRNNDFSKKAIGEAAQKASDFAAEHREDIANAARDNPELAQAAAQQAANA